MSIMVKAARMGDPGRIRAMPGIGYRQGDPGLFGDIFRKVTSVAGTVLPGPLGMGARAIHRLAGGGRATGAPQSPLDTRGKFAPKGSPAHRAYLARQGTRGLNLPGLGARGMGIGPPGSRLSLFEPQTNGAKSTAIPVGSVEVKPSGYHLNKSGYFLRDGTYIEPRSVYVKNRRRNPANPRAIDRSIGRIESAKRMASRLGRITIRKKECR